MLRGFEKASNFAARRHRCEVEVQRFAAASLSPDRPGWSRVEIRPRRIDHHLRVEEAVHAFPGGCPRRHCRAPPRRILSAMPMPHRMQPCPPPFRLARATSGSLLAQDLLLCRPLVGQRGMVSAARPSRPLPPRRSRPSARHCSVLGLLRREEVLIIKHLSHRISRSMPGCLAPSDCLSSGLP